MKIKNLIFASLTLLFVSATFNLKAQQFVKASEATPAYLKILCASADIEVVEVHEQYLRLKHTFDMYLDIDKEGRYLTLNSSYDIVPGTSVAKATALMNKINDNVLLAKAIYNAEKNKIVYRYEFWIKDGWSDKSLLSALEVFVAAMELSLEQDTEKLIK